MDGEQQALTCDRLLVQQDSRWILVPRS